LEVDESSLKSLVVLSDEKTGVSHAVMRKTTWGTRVVGSAIPLKLRRWEGNAGGLRFGGAFDKYSKDAIYSWFRISIYISYS
jgi:hypothetical protein